MATRKQRKSTTAKRYKITSTVTVLGSTFKASAAAFKVDAAVTVVFNAGHATFMSFYNGKSTIRQLDYVVRTRVMENQPAVEVTGGELNEIALHIEDATQQVGIQATEKGERLIVRASGLAWIVRSIEA